MNLFGSKNKNFIPVKLLVMLTAAGLLVLAPVRVMGFFGTGLDNKEMEEVTLHRPGDWEDDVVLEEGEWEPVEGDTEVKESYSREKVDVTGINHVDNWRISEGEGGTPGRVGAGGGEWNAHYEADWAWGGEILPGIDMSDTVYIPSMGTTPEDNDIGYFRVARIEDESGKQDLVNPREVDGDDVSDSGYVLGEHVDGSSDHERARTFYPGTHGSHSEDWIVDIFEKGDKWVQTVDMMALNEIGPERFFARRSSYSTYRRDHNERVNINTATWEALKGVQMAGPPVDDPDSPVHFLTDEMVEKIIDARGEEVSDELPIMHSSSTDYPELSPQALGDGDTISATQEICDLFDEEEPDGYENFNCDVFQEYTMPASEGILFVQIVGGPLDENQEVHSQKTLEAVVDRRPLLLEEPLEVIFKRVY